MTDTRRSVPDWVGRTPDHMPPPTVRLRIFERPKGGLLDRMLNKCVADNSGCWIWLGAKCAQGYGNMWSGSRYEKAHRVSYRLLVGSIPGGMFVCHSCDRPSCINPEHLWLGTARDNIADAISKGRYRNGSAHGERNGSAKLSADEVREIRETPKKYGSGRVLAARFGVTESTICEIRSGRSWRQE